MMNKKNKLIGYYNYTVILTYLSLVSALLAIMAVTRGYYGVSIACVGISGLFDMFDGKVARKKPNRTDSEKLFGIQLDSLCDMVAFGVTPVVVCYYIGLDSIIEILVLIFYCLCGVIRLAYFNVLEINEFFNKTGAEKVYHGLPITSISIILPIVFFLNFFFTAFQFEVLLTIVMFITGVLFICNFVIRKPSNKVIICLVTIVTLFIVSSLIMMKESDKIGELNFDKYCFDTRE